MKIAFIGAGNMTVALGKHWAAKGHDLFVCYSRDPAKLQAQAVALGPNAAVGSPAQAAAFADILVLTTPYNAAPAALVAVGKLDGKLLWSIVNPLKPDYSGLQVGTTTSGAEELAKLAAGANFVAALPPFAEALNAGLPSPPPTVFVYGGDNQGRATVSKLVEDFGASAFDSGPLAAARFFEPAMMGLVFLAYAQGMGGRIGLRLLKPETE